MFIRCVCESLIVLLSVIVGFYLICLMVKLIKTNNRFKGSCKRLVRSYRFWILTIMILTCAMQFVHYFFKLERINRTILSTFEVPIKSTGMFVVILYLFRKATKPIENKKRYMRFIQFLFFLSSTINFLFLINLYYWIMLTTEKFTTHESNYEKMYKFSQITCVSLFWLTNSTLEFLQILTFLYVVTLVTAKL